MGYARIQEEPFSVDAVLAELRHERTGGVAFYVGTVRAEDGPRRVEALAYEAFEEMAQPALENLRREAVRRFGLVDAIVVHRTGRLEAGEPILLVAMAGAHRAEALGAVAFFIEELKRVVPIWKKEHGAAGDTWVLGEGRRRVDA